MRRSARQAGFTVPELISVMIVSLLFSGLIMFFAFQYWRSSASLTNSLESFVGRLTASDRLRDAINASSGLIVQNGIEDNHTQNPDPDIGSGLYWIPLHAIPGNTPVGAAGTTTPLLYYQSLSINTSKNVIMNGAQPYEDEFVLYLDGTTKELRMRTLANAAAPSNSKTTSCPPSLATSSCPADKVIARDIASVDMRYFSRSGNLLDYTSIIDPDTGEYIGPDFPSAEVVELTLNSYKKSTLKGGSDTINQTVVRVALRND